MKHTITAAAVLTAAVLAASPATAAGTMCSSSHLSKMVTMASAMPDSPHKSMMDSHLTMINTAMAKDGMRGCVMRMGRLMNGSRMSMMMMPGT